MCTFSIVSARQLGTDMRLSIPVLFGAFNQRPTTNDLARITDIRPPEICTLSAGRAVRLRRLYESHLVAVPDRALVRRDVRRARRLAGQLAGMLQFTTTNVELAPAFSDLFVQLAHTMTFFSPDDPTEFNRPPDETTEAD